MQEGREKQGRQDEADIEFSPGQIQGVHEKRNHRLEKCK